MDPNRLIGEAKITVEFCDGQKRVYEIFNHSAKSLEAGAIVTLRFCHPNHGR